MCTIVNFVVRSRSQAFLFQITHCRCPGVFTQLRGFYLVKSFTPVNFVLFTAASQLHFHFSASQKSTCEARHLCRAFLFVNFYVLSPIIYFIGIESLTEGVSTPSFFPKKIFCWYVNGS